ncbi:MAG: cupin domain-containing protein [Acidobacteriota bacterium]|nr:cupin domain-containing protein [Acidobacteriota bacterium]
MNSINRRDLCVALSSFAALVAVAAQAQTQETGTLPETMAVPKPPGSEGDAVLSTPRAFRFEDLPVVKTANGETRAVIRGVLPTGEAVEMHETRLLPGHMPHPPHQHKHSEFMLVREGEMEFENDGKPERVGPGGVMFATSNIMHGLKNVGTTTANYFVIAIGRET